MDIHAHARPHLEVHTRSKGHSAVAGAAYRLGLRLYDEKQKCWHNFQKRALGEEIVRALTIAPKGAPAWASDPQELWNRVERSERRSDSQVARDYRIPIPFGLSDQDAGDLAEEMARFISSELNTPVSLGLHRDADRDALGNLKPNDKQGFHAHLYFPTRPLADLDEDGGKEGKGAGFGPKLYVFSKMHLGSAFIELLNCKWSELANDYSRKAGSDLKYEFKSYKRLGVNLVPQPTLGQDATAMERQGITTHRGDSLREALVMAQVYEKVHAGSLAIQHAQAVADVSRDARRPIEAVQVESGTMQSRSLRPEALHPKLLMSAKKARVAVAKPESLVIKLRALGPVPKTDAEREALERSMAFVEAIDSCLAKLDAAIKDEERQHRVWMEASAAKLDTQYLIDANRVRRKNAHDVLKTWETANALRLRLRKVAGMPVALEHVRLKKAVHLHHQHVQDFKNTLTVHEFDATDAKTLLDQVRVLIATLREKLSKAVEELKKHSEVVFDQLLSLLPVGQRVLLDGGKKEGTPSELHEVPDASHPSLQAKPSF